VGGGSESEVRGWQLAAVPAQPNRDAPALPIPPRARPRRFSPAAVRRVCEEVVTAHLAGKQWVGKEEGILTVSLTEAITARVKGASRWGWRRAGG
jgi:hypothetical protein